MSMKLSAELFNQILAGLKSDGTAARMQEKRTQGRVGLRCTLDLVQTAPGKSGGKPVTVWLRDISVNGIGFVTSLQMKEGLELVASLPRENEMPLSILYTVKYFKRLSNDLFSIGAVFERVLPDASGEVAAIGKAAGRGAR